MASELEYLTGFGNEHETEALDGALPQGQFSPQKVPYGLYAEKFNSTAFTAPRHQNRRNWFYKIRPSVVQGDYYALPEGNGLWRTGPITEIATPPNQMRWDPIPIVEAAEEERDLISGVITMAANGDVMTGVGLGIHYYTMNTSMDSRFFYNADGEMLFVPQQGRLRFHTECGILEAKPNEIVVIPRGIKFRIVLMDAVARGYIAENYGAPLELPERGPVGSDGYANDRDFLYPVAAYEEREGYFQLVSKFGGNLYASDLKYSPLDVVAWLGTSAPYKYDLAKFQVINTVSYDHPDPSIFTILSSQSDTPGVANLDFVIFPPRWMVAEHTFRPPWYHRNVMSEFMGIIEGFYDAKPGGFTPGGMSLHNCMSPHGPDYSAYTQAVQADLEPARYDNTQSFMFESRYMIQATKFALETEHRQKDYAACWQSVQSNFSG